MNPDQFLEGDGRQEIKAGVFLIDKPAGVSSFFIVRQVRKLLGIKKVGHTGTLDPFATGLLVVCAGRPATRLVELLMAGEKEYQAILQLGVETDTLDLEGKVTKVLSVPQFTDIALRESLAHFVGRQHQVPPPFSAAKFKGKPLYYYARKGRIINKEPREIEVYSITLLSYSSTSNQLEITVRCSRGTYIRVLAAEIGKRLGCGAHLIGLRRIVNGIFNVDECLHGHELNDIDSLEKLKKHMITPEDIERLLSGKK